jgi:hypothetical protein
MDNMSYTQETMTRRNIINMMRQGKLNANPIGQRPGIPSKTKPTQIINAMLNKFFTGAIILRDIREDEKAQEMYPNQQYLVIDGGNRTRAMRDFEEGKIFSKYGFINQIDADDFLDAEETVIVFKCSAAEATQVFRTINSTTVVNDMEMIMANEDSQVAKYIRSLTKSYIEYKNQPHELFSVRIKQGTTDLIIPSHFTQQHINPRREWDEFVSVVLVKCINGMKNVDAGYPVISDLVENDLPISDNVKNNVKNTLDAALKCLDFAKNKRYSKVTFGAFQMVYFELMSQRARIINFKEFSRLLWSVNTILDKKYQDKNDSIQSAKKAFGKGEVQSKLAKEYIREMGDLEGIVNFSERSASQTKKYNDLAEKGFKDTDGNVLHYDDAEWSHLTPHAEGGTEAIMERKSLNHTNLTQEEQKLITKFRSESPVKFTPMIAGGRRK